MKAITKLSQFKDLPLGTTVHRATVQDVEWWYYAGLNPKSANYVMLVSSYNIGKMECHHIGDDQTLEPYYLEYKDACKALLEKAKENLKTVEDIFINPRS